MDNKDNIIARIMDSEKWPVIQLPENLELLNELADNSFSLGTFEGMLAATLLGYYISELKNSISFYLKEGVYSESWTV